MEKLSFLEFWHKLVFRPREFFSMDFDKEKSPYFWFVLFVYGISGTVDRMERTFLKYDLQGKHELANLLNHWEVYWILAIAFGFLGGLIFYYSGGWFFNLRVRWARGKPDIKTSRFIYLYSWFIPGSIIFLHALAQTFSAPRPYSKNADVGYWEPVIDLVLILAVYYSIYVSYRGATVLMKPDKWRGRLWFVFLPWAFYTLAYIALFVSLFMMELQEEFHGPV